MRVEISEKVAKEVFMGDFRNLPIERINVDLDTPINRELLKIRHYTPCIINRYDFEGLQIMKIILKKVRKDEYYKFDVFKMFALLNVDGCWFVTCSEVASMYDVGTYYTFTEKQMNVIGERVKKMHTISGTHKEQIN